MSETCEHCGQTIKAKGSGPDKWDTKKLKVDDVLSFGKYKGMSVQDIYNEDEDYYEWLINNKVIELVAE